MSGPSWNFACPACRQRFEWRVAHAGRKLACQCGHVLDVPASPDPGTYELVDERAMSEESSNPVVPAARVLSYRQNGPPPTRAINALGTQPFRDLWLPIALILFGMLAIATYSFFGARPVKPWLAPTAPSFASVLQNLGFLVVWKVSVLMLAIVIAAKLLDVGFGFAPIALVKVGAIALAPLGMWDAVALAGNNDVSAQVVGWMLSIPVYWWLFSYLFELDFRETIVSVIVTTLLNWLAFLVIRVWIGW